MARYVLYLDVTNLPSAKAKQYMANMAKSVRDSEFIEKDDKLFICPRKYGLTEIVKFD